MKNQIITISLSVVLSVIFSLFSLRVAEKLGAVTVISTASSDTLETFRTNVNTSLSQLSAYAVSTTSAQTWTAAQSYLAAVTIGATASTTITTDGKVGIASTTPLGSLGIGAGTATSTISGGNFCAQFKDEAGRLMYIKLATSGSHVFSSSTSSCI